MVKFVHVRQIDELGNLLSNGGLTIAYTATKKDIFLSHAQCSWLDNFNRRVGRQIAAGRMRKYGSEDIIARKDPISKTVVEWAEKLFGEPISIKWNAKARRWESTFEALELAPNEFELGVDPIEFKDESKGKPAPANDIPPDLDTTCTDCQVQAAA